MIERVLETQSSIPASGGVHVERQARVARVMIHRPPLNVLDTETIRELRSRLEEAASDPAIHLVEIGSAVPAAFSSGTDIREHFSATARELLSEFHALIRTILYSPRPTVALVEGTCLGGGMELAMACDFIIATRAAKFGLPEIRLG